MAVNQEGGPKSRREHSMRRRSAQTSAANEDGPQERVESPRDESGSRGKRRLRASEVARSAIREVYELTGREPEGCTSLQRGEHGWIVGVEVVESRRIPDTTDVLAVYETELDESAELLSYRRVNRYPRGRGDERRE